MGVTIYSLAVVVSKDHVSFIHYLLWGQTVAKGLVVDQLGDLLEEGEDAGAKAEDSGFVMWVLHVQAATEEKNGVDDRVLLAANDEVVPGHFASCVCPPASVGHGVEACILLFHAICKVETKTILDV